LQKNENDDKMTRHDMDFANKYDDLLLNFDDIKNK